MRRARIHRDWLRDLGDEANIAQLPACNVLKQSLPRDSWQVIWQRLRDTFLTKALAFTPTEKDANHDISMRKGVEELEHFLARNEIADWNGQKFVIDEPYKLIDLVARLVLTWPGGAGNHFHKDFRPVALDTEEVVPRVWNAGSPN
jgi:hypothetical protein